MTIKRGGFHGLGVAGGYPPPDLSLDEHRLYHLAWLEEFKWHHAVRHWIFGGRRPLPLGGTNSISNARSWPAIWHRIYQKMNMTWHRVTKSKTWREYQEWQESLPPAPEPGEASVVFVDGEGIWTPVANISRDGKLKWFKPR